MRGGLRRGERRRLRRAAQLTLAEAHARVEAQADKTEKSLPGPTQEEIDLWFKHSYGSWRKDRG